MKDINYFKEKIKEKRKTTKFKDYILEISSWIPFSFYKNNGNISRYPKTERSPKVISNTEFIKNRDDILKYGIDYNFDIDFFDNFKKLFLTVPMSANISQMAGENTDFSDTVVASQNVYLSNIVVENCENVFYSFEVITNCTNVFNSSVVFRNCENIFYSKGIIKSSKIFYSKYIDNCFDIWFSSNMIGCRECIFCNDLENKSYCIENIEYSKGEYLIKKDEILKKKNKFENNYLKVDNIGKNTNCTNVTGMFVKNSENIKNGFFIPSNASNFKNAMFAGDGKDYYDCFDVGIESRDMYAVEGGGNYSNNIFCSSQIETCYNIFYSYYCNNSNNLLGCIGLSNKSFCIFNKQYTKDEYKVLSEKILESMEKEGNLGKFFPAKLCPFYFNDSFSGMYSGIRKEKAIEIGYLWREEEIKPDIPDESKIISISDLDKYEGFDNSGKWKINPEILEKVIKDENGNYYRIVKMELDFLQKHELPLPRLHWLDRMKLNFGV